MRIVSLLPSATEIVCLLGAGDRLVGRSHECDHPPEVLPVPALTAQTWENSGLSPGEIDRVVSSAVSAPGSAEQGGARSLYSLDVDRLHSLQPDLIITQDLCSVCSIDVASVRGAAARMTPAPQVLSLNTSTFEGLFEDVMAIGRVLGVERRASDVVVALRERFFHAADFVNPFDRAPRVCVLDWADPLYVAGHWTPQLVERAGGEHPLNPTSAMPGAGAGAGGQMAHRFAGPSRRISADDLIAAAPEAIVLCPCGVALRDIPAHLAIMERQAWWSQLPAVGTGRVALVDGNQMFSRPGPRLVDAFEWLVGWLNDRPQLIPAGFPWMLAPPRK